MGTFLSSLSGAVIIQGGALAILSAVIYAILRGGLVPRATLDRVVAGYEAQVKAAERREGEWREVALLAQGHTGQLLVTARVAEATLAALPTDGAEAP